MDYILEHWQLFLYIFGAVAGIVIFGAVASKQDDLREEDVVSGSLAVIFWPLSLPAILLVTTVVILFKTGDFIGKKLL